MTYEPASSVRARRLRERRSMGVVMVATVEVGETCLAALEQWAGGRGLRFAGMV